MQLTVEFDDASQIAALAHIAELIKCNGHNDGETLRGIYPLHIIHSMNTVLDALDFALDYLDSPYNVAESVGIEASTMAKRMQAIGQRIPDLKNEGPAT